MSCACTTTQFWLLNWISHQRAVHHFLMFSVPPAWFGMKFMQSNGYFMNYERLPRSRKMLHVL